MNRSFRFLKKFNHDSFFQTSAKTGEGVTELTSSIRKAIPWEDLPVVSTPEIFRLIKAFLIREKEEGRILSGKERSLGLS